MKPKEIAQKARELGEELVVVQQRLASAESASARSLYGAVSIVLAGYERLVAEADGGKTLHYKESARIVTHLHVMLTDLVPRDGLLPDDDEFLQSALRSGAELLQAFELAIDDDDDEQALAAAREANQKLAAAIGKGKNDIDDLIHACHDANRAAVEQASDAADRAEAVRETVYTYALIRRRPTPARQQSKVSV